MKILPRNLSTLIWYFIKKQPIAFSIIFLTPLTMVLETNLLPFAFKKVIDTIANYQDDRANIIKVITPFLFLGASAWISFTIIIRLQGWLRAYTIPRFEANIRISVLGKIINHSCHYFSDKLKGDIANKINDLPRSMSSILMIVCWNIIASFVIVLITLVIMTTINLVFSFILGLWVIIHLMVSIYFARFINQVSKKMLKIKAF